MFENIIAFGSIFLLAASFRSLEMLVNFIRIRRFSRILSNIWENYSSQNIYYRHMYNDNDNVRLSVRIDHLKLFEKNNHECSNPFGNIIQTLFINDIETLSIISIKHDFHRSRTIYCSPEIRKKDMITILNTYYRKHKLLIR